METTPARSAILRMRRYKSTQLFSAFSTRAAYAQSETDVRGHVCRRIDIKLRYFMKTLTSSICCSNLYLDYLLFAIISVRFT